MLDGICGRWFLREFSPLTEAISDPMLDHFPPQQWVPHELHPEATAQAPPGRSSERSLPSIVAGGRNRTRCGGIDCTGTDPARVWAMDFTEPPAPINGLYRYLFAVRDLAID